MYEHAFGKSDPYTLGVEEEYMLLDATTFDLVQHIDTVLAAVEGSSLEHVVRTRIYVTDAGYIDEVGRAHAEAFATARPATTGIVTSLLDPRWRVEIEAEAVIVDR